MFSSIGTVSGISISGALFGWASEKGLHVALSCTKSGKEVRDFIEWRMTRKLTGNRLRGGRWRILDL
jgi:hypothetical protein